MLLPLYDAQGGEVTLRYERTRGEGDLPDDNTISLESALRSISLTYQEYSSMTGVRVIQGSLTSQPGEEGAFTVEEGGEAPKNLAVSFSLKQEEGESKDDELRDVYTYQATLNLWSDGEGEGYVAVPETEVTIASRFASKELKSAATDMDMTLTLGGDGWDQTITLTAVGRSRQKWEPEAISTDRVYVSRMTEGDVAALLPGVALRFATLMSDYLAAAPAPSAAPEASAEPEPSATPDATEAPARTAGPDATAEAETEPSAEPAQTPEASQNPAP